MYPRHARAAAALMITAALLAGCGSRTDPDAGRKSFDSIAGDAVSVYTRLHPLRSSRLGLEGADSMLFTFSAGEIEEAVSAVDTMLAALSALPADGLDAGRVDESVLLSDWMKGEIFVFSQSRTCLDNPLLFCWMLEEALMSLPARPEPPCEGERRAWAARLSRVPALVGNAPGFLKKPGGVQLEEAAARLDALLGRRAELKRMAGKRYGGPVPELDTAMEAVREYRDLLGPFLGARTSSRQIMGLEELSNILRYSEHLDFDPGKMIGEAEKTMRRLSRQIVPSTVSVRYPETSGVTVTAGLADSLLASIEKGLSSKRSFGGLKRERPAAIAYEKMWEPLRVPVNPYLTLPAVPERDVRWHIAPCGGRGCTPSVLVPDGEPMTLDRLQFGLLMSSSLISSPFRKMCAEASQVRRVFCAETYRYAWSEHNSGDLTALFPEQRMLLSRIETRGRVGALARLILVFRLNSGKFTTEAAADYLRELVPLGEGWIEDEVRLAALSPCAAFEGIAYLTVESMLKKAVVERAGGRPRDRVRKLLIESAGMPPYLLLMRMPS